MKLILCMEADYAAARADFPDNPIMCTDTRALMMPNYADAIEVATFQLARAQLSRNSERYEPSR